MLREDQKQAEGIVSAERTRLQSRLTTIRNWMVYFAKSGRAGQTAQNPLLELFVDGVSVPPSYRKPFDMNSCVRLRPTDPKHVWRYDFVSGRRTMDGECGC
jgi:hypothetical protein